MNDYNYPFRHDMKQALSKDFVSAKFVQNFAQQKGIFIFRAGQEGVTDFLSSLFFENQELEIIRNRAFKNSPERTLSSFKYIEEDDNSQTPVDAIEEHIKKLAQSENPNNVQISNPTAVKGEEGTFHVRIEYTKNKKGRISLLQKEKHDFDAYIKQDSPSTYSIITDSTSSSDQKFILDILKQHLNKSGKFNKLELEKLKSAETVLFFDELGKKGMDDNWKFEEVTKLVLRKPQENEEEEEGEDKTVLQGITQAILEGTDLRQNPFVVNSEKNGYRFTAMTYKFEHLREPYVIEISVQFKGRPKVFEVSIKKYKIKEVEANLDPALGDIDYPHTEMEIKKYVLAVAETIYRKILSKKGI